MVRIGSTAHRHRDLDSTNHDILEQLLHLSEAEIAQLEVEGVIGEPEPLAMASVGPG